HRLSAYWDPQQTTDDLRQLITSNERVGEHEGKPPVVPQGFEARLETKVRYRIVRVIEPAHRLVEETHQIGDPIRHGRIDRNLCSGGTVNLIAVVKEMPIVRRRALMIMPL